LYEHHIEQAVPAAS